MLPLQPVIRAEDGIIRFKRNPLVRFLLDAGPFDLNFLAHIPATKEEHAQLAELIGYSVSGYGDLSYVSDARYELADSAAREVRKDAT